MATLEYYLLVFWHEIFYLDPSVSALQSQSPATSFFGLLQNFAYFKWIPKLAFS